MPESPALILAAIGLTSFLESLALAGLLVPGVVVLFSLAALANTAGIPIPHILIVAAIGGFIGDIASFYLGKCLLPNALYSKRLSRYESWITQSQWFIQTWGWLSIIIGRFLGPLRPIIPMVAGALGMKAKLFITLSFFTCIVWAPAYLLPGYFTGELSELWKLQPLDMRSLVTYTLTLFSVCAFILIVYHHMHPDKMHLRGWITKHQSERWPIAPTALLISCLAIALTIKQIYPLPIDLRFIDWAAHWQTLTVATKYITAFNALSEHRLVYLQLTMVILWLIMISRFSIAIITIIGGVALHSSINHLSLLMINSNNNALWNLAIFIYTAALLATLTNSTKAGQNRWPVYFSAFSLGLAMTISHLWLGHIEPTAGILTIVSATAVLATIRAFWKLFNKIPKAPIPLSILLLLLALNCTQLIIVL
jgi:undecaprenyl-diphosphatase